jgi:UDP-glucuronate decarboxylase
MTTKPKFQKKNVFVLGGAGFLGSALCEELLKSSRVVCIDNFATSSVENIRFLLVNEDFIFINHGLIQPLDLATVPELKRLDLATQGIQEIYNLACPTSAKNFDHWVEETLWANSLIIKQALSWARQYEAKFLHASSAVVYGNREYHKDYVVESDLGLVNHLTPRGCYDEGKRFAETIVETFNQKYKANYKIARIFRTYGPRMLLNDGQMILDFIMAAIQNNDLIIYGDKSFNTSLCYIDDVIQGLVKLMDSEVVGPINVGNDKDLSLVAVAEKIIELTKSSSKVVFKDPLLFMTQLGLPDITKAKHELSWFPLITLEQGLSKTIQYVQANRSLLDTQYQQRNIN